MGLTGEAKKVTQKAECKVQSEASGMEIELIGIMRMIKINFKESEISNLNRKMQSRDKISKMKKINQKEIMGRMGMKRMKEILKSGIVFGVLVLTVMSSAQGATNTFQQTNWSGGSSALTGIDPTNQTGWTKFATSTSATVGANVKIGTSDYSLTQTDATTGNTGFNLADKVFSSSEVVGSGDSASVKLTSSAGIDVGTGADGAIVISSAKNINTNTIASGRTCADGIAYNVTALTGTTATLSGTPAAGCLATNDKIILINLQGNGTNLSNVGNYEFLTVSSVSTNVVTFSTSKTKNYGNGADDTNLGTATTNQRVVLQRVPQYTNVTISSGGSLTASGWNGQKGGILAFLANGTVTVASGGSIDVSATGFRTGAAGTQGESYNALGTGTPNAYGGGTSAFIWWDYLEADIQTSAGGGYGSAGDSVCGDGGTCVTGGATYGSADLSKLFLGSGGGSWGSLAGSGGGIIYIGSNSLSVSGAINNNGASGGGQGGGSGGSTYLIGNSLTLGTDLVSSAGGAYSSAGPEGLAGGVGRIYVKSNNISGTTSPVATTGSVSTVYNTPGTYTSGAIDVGVTPASWGNLSWVQTGGQTITIKARTDADGNFSNATDWASCGNISSGSALTSGSPNCVTNGQRYIQYQATLSTADTSATPSLDSVTIGYSKYNSSSTIISSAYDSNSDTNVILGLNWEEDTSLPTNTAVSMAFRTGADLSALQAASWSSEYTNATANCSKGVSNLVICSAAAIPAENKDLSGDRWFQYRLTLTSSDGANTPTITAADVLYDNNQAPAFQTTATATQVATTTDVNFGKVRVDFSIRDTDTTSNTATTTLEYSTDGGSTWSALSSNLTFYDGSDAVMTSPLSVQTSAYNSYYAIWDAKTALGSTYNTNVKIRVTLNDGQLYNATAQSTTGVFTLDTTNPTGTLSIAGGAAYASSTNVTLNISGSDDSAMQMRFGTGGGSLSWGSHGAGDGQFNMPQDVTVDSSGNVYVVDTNNARVQKFTSTGSFVTKWGSYGNGNGQFGFPFGIAVDGSGNVYVGENNRIQKFTSSGSFVTKWGSYGSGNSQFNNPQGIAVDGSGNVYVADAGNNRVQKFTSTGSFITKWGSVGAGNGQFNGPYGVAVDTSGNVYVVDAGNNRVQKFTSTGSFITKWGSSGSGNGQFGSPSDIAVDISGNVYVADFSDRVQKFTSTGSFITKWGSSGSGLGQFSGPYGVAVDTSENVYVADAANNRIQAFSSTGGNPMFWSSWESYGTTKSYTLASGDGSKSVSMQLRDVTGNTSANISDAITLDTTAPTGSISLPATTSSTSVTATLSATDSGSGVATMKFSNDNIIYTAPEGYATSKAYTLSEGDGVKTVYVKFIDNAGAASAAYSASTTLDTTAPTGTISVNSGATYATSTAITLNLSATDTGSGVYQMQFSDNDSTWSAPESYATTKAYTLPVGDGTKTVYVRYVDNVGITSTSTADTIILDTTAPTGTISINSGATYASSTSATLTLSATDSGTGVYQMAFSNDDATYSTWEAYNTTKSWTMASGDGTKTVYVKFKDNAGVISTAISSTITLDTQAPTGTINLPQYASSTVTAALSATDSGSGMGTMQFSTDDVIYSAPQAYTTSATVNLSAGDGVKTVYVKFIDNGGAVSTAYSASTTIDTTAPTGSISINSDATYTTSTSVALNLNATDVLSGVAQMAFSDDNVIYSNWEDYNITKSWTIPAGDGIKTVYVKFKDNAGVASSGFSDTIILDTTAPELATDSVLINNSSSVYQSETQDVNVTLQHVTGNPTGEDVQVQISRDGGTTWYGANSDGSLGAVGEWGTATSSANSILGPWVWSLQAKSETISVRAKDSLENIGNTDTNGATFNKAPVISAVAASQVSDSGDPNYGKVKISYGLKDDDNDTNTVSLQYSINGGSTWNNLLSLSGDYGSKSVTASPVSMNAYWDAKTDLPDSYYASALVKITANDGELLNATTTVNTASFAIDAKAPTADSATTLLINDTTGSAENPVVSESANITLKLQNITSDNATDTIFVQFSKDNSTWYGANNDNTLASAGSWGTGFSLSNIGSLSWSWTMVSRSETIRIRIKDQFDNTLNSAASNVSGYNIRPQFDLTYGTNGLNISQISDSASADWGKINVEFKVRDEDADTGTTPNELTPTFEYSLNEGAWTALATSTISTSNVTITSTYPTNAYSRIWDVKSQLANTSGDVRIRLTVNDNEQLANTTSTISNSISVDAKNPEVTATIDGVNNRLTINAIDDSNISYRYTLAGAAATDWVASGATALTNTQVESTFTASSTDVSAVVDIRDLYGNTTTANVVAPTAPSNIQWNDLSNPSIGSYKEFVAWDAYTSVAGRTFAKYDLYRSNNASSTAKFAEITSINQNYYLDTTVNSSDTYYYSVAVEDSNGDVSPLSNTVSDIPNGVGGTDTVAANITDIQVTAQSTSATITWTTDELTDSLVEYSLANGTSTPFGLTKSSATRTLSHLVVLIGLTPNTQYKYRITSVDASTNSAVSDNGGSGYAFTTLGGPIITQVASDSVTDTTAHISWHTDKTSTSIVYYSNNSSFNGYNQVTGTVSAVEGSENDFLHSADITGLSNGTTYYYYVKSVDGDGNATTDNNSNNYYNFHTNNDIYPPLISSVSTPVITTASAIVFWQTDELATSQVLYGTTESLDHETTLDVFLTTNHSVVLTGLSEETPYFYKVKSKDAFDNLAESTTTTFTTTKSGDVIIMTGGGGGGVSNVTEDKTAPKISNVQVATTTAFTATISFDTDEPTLGFVEYGKDVNYGNTAGDKNLTTHHDVRLAGLKLGTEYHFQVQASDKASNITADTDRTFKTKFFAEIADNLKTVENAEQFQQEIDSSIESILPSIIPPFVEKPVVTEITEDSAVVTWSTNIASFSVVSYATEDEYNKEANKPYAGEVSDTTTKTKTHKLLLTGLKPSTKYHFMAKSFSLPQVIGKSDDVAFVTKAAKVKASIVEIKNTSFKVAWSTDIAASTIVDYRNIKTGINQRKIDDSKQTYHNLLIDGLQPAATYEVKVSGYTENGSFVDGGDAQNVTTSKDVLAPKISGFKVDSALVPGRTDKLQTIVTWVTDEPANSTVYYQEGSSVTKEFTTKVEDLTTYTQNHALIIPGFKPGTLYQLKLISSDQSGNKSTFGPRTIITPKQTESIFDVIFKNFEDTFKFMRNVGQ